MIQDALKPTLVNALKIPIETTTLPNGLKVVVAPDTTAPVVTVGIYYKIGFRLEPQGRSGFAHLFEHMMFQGSANAPKMQHIKLINSSGGLLNGSTHYDVTNYYESVPSNALETVCPKRQAVKNVAARTTCVNLEILIDISPLSCQKTTTTSS